MQSFQLIKPCLALAPYIRHYWILQDDSVTPVSERTLPIGCMQLVFHKGKQLLLSGESELQPQSFISGQSVGFSDVFCWTRAMYGSCTGRTVPSWKSPFPWVSARPCASCAATSAPLMFSCRWKKTLSWQWATTAKPPSRTNRWCSASLRISEPTASAGRPTQKQLGRGRAPGPL